MWDLTDKLLNNFYKKYTIQDLQDDILDIFDRIEPNDKIASKENINRFKRYINKNYNDYDDYGKYKAKRFLNRLKITNNDILKFMIYTTYSKKQKKLDEFENLIFQELIKDTYEKETIKINKETKRKIPNPPIYVVYALLLLAMPNSKGYKWKDYNSAVVSYNSDETYRYLITNNKKKLKDLLLKQKKRLINKKTDDKIDKFSGSLDNEVVFIVNQTKIKAYEDMEIKKVKFISVDDIKTTEMCHTLNGQIFKINDWNKYDRYSAFDKRIIRYTTYGLKVGDNLPPINNHFHYCRSTITYQIGE